MSFMHLNRKLYISQKLRNMKILFPELLEIRFQYNLGSSFLFNNVLIFQHPSFPFLRKTKIPVHLLDYRTLQSGNGRPFCSWEQ